LRDLSVDARLRRFVRQRIFPIIGCNHGVYAMQSEYARNIVRFGAFELDPQSGELSSGGVRIPLQEQPFQILKLLTDRPGEVVTREEIQSRLWPDDTTVEFENAVNAAVKKLRIALGDSAEEPRYIETLRRRGYRLMVPVERLANLPATQTAKGVQHDPAPRQTASGKQGAVTSAAGRWRGILSFAGIVLAVVAFAYIYSRRTIHATSTLTDRDKIVLADFSNTTNDPVFNDTLRQGLTVQLEQSPFLNLVTEDRIQQALTMMGKPPDTALTPPVALEICQRTGSTAVLDGSIASLGSQYVLGLRTRSCRTGSVIDEEQQQAAKKEDVLNALSQIASKFRSRAGESLAGAGQLDVPLAEATTSSLDALKAYSMGMKVLYSGGSGPAVPLFKRATEIDPQFAMAYAMLGRVYGDVAESGLSGESTKKAWELRSHANEQERYFIDASYEIQVIGNMEKAEQTCEAWIQTYPRESHGRGFLAGMIYPVLGKYEAALEQSKKMVELDPDFPISWNLLALAYVPFGRLDESAGVLQQASDRGMQIPDLLIDHYLLAFLKDDKPGMDKVVASASKESGAEDVIANLDSFAAAYSGHLQQANTRSELAVRLAQQAGQRERAALFQSAAAIREGFFGNATAAKQTANAALALSNERDIAYGAAFALALAGDTTTSQTLADDIEKRLPEDTAVKFGYLPVLRATLALNHHSPERAIELLQPASAYELGEAPSSFYGFFGSLYPVYLRGEAYLTLHQGPQAVAEFQKIIDHRGIVLTDPIGALARLQLGRAYAMAGDQSKAKAAYNDFLNLWKDADANIPVLKQARMEHAQLH
jgi:DNA-binding winged helix-turn-helix (wHTH) protein/tetratricopeptide (TPR) repeat protein